MRLALASTATFAATAVLCATSGIPSTRAQPQQHKTNLRRQRRRGAETHNRRIIVQCKPATEEHCRQELEEAPVGIIVHEHKGTDFFALQIEDDDYEHFELTVLQALGDVLEIVDDPLRSLKVMPDSFDHGPVPPSRPLFQKDRDNRNLASSAVESVPYGIDLVRAPEVWEKYNRRGQGVKICVVDTGIHASHEDFQGLTMVGRDSGAFWNRLEWDEDGDGHGTHVAGTCAAVAGNGKGVVGVAPEADLIIARVFDDDGLFYGSDLIAAMEDCEEQGADIITMSLGGPGSSTNEENTINRLVNEGIFVVAATGNSGRPYANPPFTGPLEFPAGYSNVVGVGATNSNRAITSFSTFGEQVDIVAPGQAIDSTFIDPDNLSRNNIYTPLSGTSMATPHVAGVAALLKSINPTISPVQMREVLTSTAIKTAVNGSPYDPFMYGSGHVDALAAAQSLAPIETISPSPTLAPTVCDECAGGVVELQTDEYGGETTWKIVEAGSDAPIFLNGGPYSNGVEQLYTIPFELSSTRCYELVIKDAYGDGICCGYGNGYIKVTFDGKESAIEDFGSAPDKSKTEGRIQFGSCGGGGGGIPITPPPVPSPTTAPVSPTVSPTVDVPEPTRSPTSVPTASPTSRPTSRPTDSPTNSVDNNVVITVNTDRYAEESSWAILTLDGSVLASGGPYTNPSEDEAIITESLPLPSDGCYQFMFYDSYGDGVCCEYGSGSYSLDLDGVQVILMNSNENFEEMRHYLGNAPGCPSADGCGNGIVEGTEQCDEGENNSDGPDATCSTSCEFIGMPMAAGYVRIVSDNYGSETTWTIKTSDGEMVASGGPYTNDAGVVYETTFEAQSDDCYTFEILDSYGDGNCCAYGFGSHSIFFGDSMVANSASFSSGSATIEFGNC